MLFSKECRLYDSWEPFGASAVILSQWILCSNNFKVFLPFCLSPPFSLQSFFPWSPPITQVKLTANTMKHFTVYSFLSVAWSHMILFTVSERSTPATLPMVIVLINTTEGGFPTPQKIRPKWSTRKNPQMAPKGWAGKCDTKVRSGLAWSSQASGGDFCPSSEQRSLLPSDPWADLERERET